MGTLRGNAITARRIALLVQDANLETRIVDTKDRGHDPSRADIVHSLHATRTGEYLREVALSPAQPLVVSLTGTDLNADLYDHRLAPVALAALARANAIVAFHSLALPAPLRTGSLAEKLHLIPQSIDPSPFRSVAEQTSQDARQAAIAEFGLVEFLGADAIVFLLTAGIRPVKQVDYALAPLAALYARDRRIRFVLAGPVLDAAEGRRVAQAMAAYPFARYLGVVANAQMPTLNLLADICLNTSLSEGMSQAVLEGMAAGRPLLCHAIAGNQALVEHGTTGFLYATPAEFAALAATLAADAGLRARLGAAGRERVLAQHTPERERRAYSDLYQGLLAARRRRDDDA